MCTPPLGGRAAAGGEYSCTIRCAFEPPAPKDEMPAIRGSLRPSMTGGSHGLSV
jgi:hypothetical protein